MRVSTFLLEPKKSHRLSENAGLDLDVRVSTFVLEPKMAHSQSETTILDFLHRDAFVILDKPISRERGSFKRWEALLHACQALRSKQKKRVTEYRGPIAQTVASHASRLGAGARQGQQLLAGGLPMAVRFA